MVVLFVIVAMLVVFHVIDSGCDIYYFCYVGGVQVLVIV